MRLLSYKNCRPQSGPGPTEAERSSPCPRSLVSELPSKRNSPQKESSHSLPVGEEEGPPEEG